MRDPADEIGRRSLLIGGALAATGLAAFAAAPRRIEQDLAAQDLSLAFPETVGPWTGAPAGLDVVADVDDPKREQIFSRNYFAYGLPALTLIVTYHGPATSDMKAHLPDVCYAVAGFSISDRGGALLDLGPPARPLGAARFTATRGERVEQVFYLARVGRYFPTTFPEERGAVLEEALHGVVADGAVLRISTLSPTMESALPRLEAFAKAFLRASQPAGRAAVLGPAARIFAPAPEGPPLVSRKGPP